MMTSEHEPMQMKEIPSGQIILGLKQDLRTNIPPYIVRNTLADLLTEQGFSQRLYKEGDEEFIFVNQEGDEEFQLGFYTQVSGLAYSKRVQNDRVIIVEDAVESVFDKLAETVDQLIKNSQPPYISLSPNIWINVYGQNPSLFLDHITPIVEERQAARTNSRGFHIDTMEESSTGATLLLSPVEED